MRYSLARSMPGWLAIGLVLADAIMPLLAGAVCVTLVRKRSWSLARAYLLVSVTYALYLAAVDGRLGYFSVSYLFGTPVVLIGEGILRTVGLHWYDLGGGFFVWGLLMLTVALVLIPTAAIFAATRISHWVAGRRKYRPNLPK